MALLNPKATGESVRFDDDECAALGARLHADYDAADPYPHAVLDDFLPLDLLRRVNEEFPGRKAGRFADDQSNLKTGYQLDLVESPFITNLLSALNAAPFLGFLEALTGIERLLPDPYFDGSGLHETARGGHLSIHTDFNLHRKFPLFRRINLILFLNEDWEEEYGGELELWSRDMQERRNAVLPCMARAVVFNTDESSYHGHPEPLRSPEGVYRRSIALYYFTVPEDPGAIRKHTTRFVRRAGSLDKRALKTWRKEFFLDWCPPVLVRALRRLRGR